MGRLAEEVGVIGGDQVDERIDLVPSLRRLQQRAVVLVAVEPECEKPTVYDGFRNKVTEASKNPIYRGCYVNAVVEFYGDDRYSAGVFCKLVGIQFRKDGDAFGSAPARADDFDVVEGAEAEDFA